MKNPAFATSWNADVMDELYTRWMRDTSSVDASWNAFFEGFELARSTDATTATGGEGGADTGELSRQAKLQARFTGAIYAYRSIGHTQAQFNPLQENPANPRLDLERLGFTEGDLDWQGDTGNYQGGRSMSVRELISSLKRTYCGSIGVEYLHIQETPKRRFLQAEMEATFNTPSFAPAKKRRILEQILAAEDFEKFLHKSYVGQKRFSLEGGETIIAALDALIEAAPAAGVEAYVMGMAHRGRLNVLANILGKSHEFLFREFSENYIPESMHGDGDVKYHLGYDSVRHTQGGGEVELHLAANPSHLEAVNPVVQGRARAQQRLHQDTAERTKVIPILLHGDAAFAGQGVVAETLNFSKLKGYRTGGTLHFVINNQIGFTTDPTDARSSRYCTDVAKMIEAPVFHVNGDDPEAMVYVTELALKYRQTFHEDVVIDMYCYRRHGHNEADEPKFTQPVLYAQIDQHPLISDSYAQRLLEEKTLTKDEVKKIKQTYNDKLDEAFTRVKEQEEARSKQGQSTSSLAGSTATYQPEYSFERVGTGVEEETLTHVAKTLCTLPESFSANPKIRRQLETKWKAFESGEGIDWAFAESLAFGTLMLEGIPVRLSGQDSERGTFSQRHAVLYDTKTRERYLPLLHLSHGQASLCIYNSLLSEAAVLGFDYGYSLDYPQMLCLWEAQFGDFVNGAQVIIDQFITSSESKWQRVSGIVLLLPHGYEGQGPEHSSARLERFLQACAEDNIQVVFPSTPAQLFHLLRRQMHRGFRKPLVVMSPKSLLRHKACTSKVSTFVEAHFEEVLDDPRPPEKAERIVLCSGKVFYDLDAYRQEHGITNTALVRVEQLYPLHKKRLREVLDRHQSASKVIWCQEEPANMGAWSFIRPHLREILGADPAYAGRDAGASPAVGSLAVHKIEQAGLVETAFLS